MPLAACSHRRRTILPALLSAFTGLFLVLSLGGCEKEKPKAQGRPPVEITEFTIEPRDTPVAFEFVGQTQSSREVEIRARVDGFLEKRVYVEGELVFVGQPMFLMDRKPFEAALQQAKGELAQRQAQLDTANANLTRIRPLAEQNAVSKKDLDDAVGAFQSAQAQVLAAKGNVRTAELNLSYTTISSPLTGLSSFAKLQDGAYVNATNSLLTTVSQLDPIWVNYSISENELLKFREDAARGLLKLPPNRAFEVEIVLADGSVFPDKGRVTFSDPSFSKETGTFLVRAVLPNPKPILRPGQFVRVRVLGASRPNAILVPQRAVLQGAKSHFVWVIGKDDKPEQRVVEVGDWHGDQWFINEGLKPGEKIVVDGAIRMSVGATVKVLGAHVPKAGASPADAPPTASPPLPGTERLQAPASRGQTPQPPAREPPTGGAKENPIGAIVTPAGTGQLVQSLFFAPGSASLDPEAQAAVEKLASSLKADANSRFTITGYTDKTGTRTRNVDLAKQRAQVLHQALRQAGVNPRQLSLKPPEDITGDPDNHQARRVDVHAAQPPPASDADAGAGTSAK